MDGLPFLMFVILATAAIIAVVVLVAVFSTFIFGVSVFELLNYSRDRQAAGLGGAFRSATEALDQNAALRHVEHSLFQLVDGQRTVQVHVAPDGRTTLWVAVDSESGADEPDLEYLTPTLSPGWILTWVDPAHPLAALYFILPLAQAIEGYGPWIEFAEARELRLNLSPEFQPSLSGSLNGRDLHLRLGVSTVSIKAEVDDSLRAVPGKGATGNPVLDMFLDTSNVSADLTESVLALLHPGSGQIQHGTLTSIVPIGLAEAWPHLVRLTAFCKADPS